MMVQGLYKDVRNPAASGSRTLQDVVPGRGKAATVEALRSTIPKPIWDINSPEAAEKSKELAGFLGKRARGDPNDTLDDEEIPTGKKPRWNEDAEMGDVNGQEGPGMAQKNLGDGPIELFVDGNDVVRARTLEGGSDWEVHFRKCRPVPVEGSIALPVTQPAAWVIVGRALTGAMVAVAQDILQPSWRAIWTLIDGFETYDEDLDWVEDMGELRNTFRKMAFPRRGTAAVERPESVAFLEESVVGLEDQRDAEALRKEKGKAAVRPSKPSDVDGTNVIITLPPKQPTNPKAAATATPGVGAAMDPAVMALLEKLGGAITTLANAQAQNQSLLSLQQPLNLFGAGQDSALDAIENLNARKRNHVQIIPGFTSYDSNEEVSRAARQAMSEGGWEGYIPLPLFGTGDAEMDERASKGTKYSKSLKDLTYDGWNKEEEFDMSAAAFIRGWRSFLVVMEEFFPRRAVFWKEYLEEKEKIILMTKNVQFEVILDMCHRRKNPATSRSDPRIVTLATREEAQLTYDNRKAKKVKAEAEAAAVLATEKTIARMLGGNGGNTKFNAISNSSNGPKPRGGGGVGSGGGRNDSGTQAFRSFKSIQGGSGGGSGNGFGGSAIGNQAGGQGGGSWGPRLTGRIPSLNSRIVGSFSRATESLSAPGTTIQLASTVIPATSSIPVRPATPMNTDPADALDETRRIKGRDDVRRVVTPLKVDVWEEYLIQCGLLDRYKHVVEGIRFGFRTSSSLVLSKPTVYENHPSAFLHSQAVLDHIAKECTDGRYAGPFSYEQATSLFGVFRVSPFGVVPKSNGKFRIIQDASWPRNDPENPSLNSSVNVEDFPVDWDGVKEMVECVVTAPPGAQGALVDWSNAFRNIPIHPDDQHLHMVGWAPEKGSALAFWKFWWDFALMFGHALACGIFSMVNTAFIAIVTSMLAVLALDWVDDDQFRRDPIPGTFPYQYSVTLKDITDIALKLGIPLSKEKCTEFSFDVMYLGLLWHYDTKRVEVPMMKKKKYSVAVMGILEAGKVDLKTMESVTGQLSFISAIVPNGRAYLWHLYQMGSEMKKYADRKDKPWVLWKGVVADLEWWKELAKEYLGMNLCKEIIPDDSMKVYVDASSGWGIGIVIGDEYEAFKWTGERMSEVVKEGCDIAWAEFVAVHLAILALIHHFQVRRTHFLIRSDNQAVVGAWKKRSSRNEMQNEVIKSIFKATMPEECFVSLEWVSTKDNVADEPSRGVAIKGMKRVNFRLGRFPDSYKGLMTRNVVLKA